MLTSQPLPVSLPYVEAEPKSKYRSQALYLVAEEMKTREVPVTCTSAESLSEAGLVCKTQPAIDSVTARWNRVDWAPATPDEVKIDFEIRLAQAAALQVIQSVFPTRNTLNKHIEGPLVLQLKTMRRENRLMQRRVDLLNCRRQIAQEDFLKKLNELERKRQELDMTVLQLRRVVDNGHNGVTDSDEKELKRCRTE